MSVDRFTIIHKFFHLSDNKNDNKKDLIYKVRPLVELHNNLSQFYYIPGKSLNIDEAMIKFKGRLKFRQYICNKPVKFGIKAFLLCNSINGYCYNITIYTGKGTTEVLDKMNMTESVVINMIRPYLHEWRILYVDSYYNTINLNLFLLANKTGLIGFFRKNRNRSHNKIKYPKQKGGSDIYMNEPENTICMVYVKDRKEFIITSNVNYPKSVSKSSKYSVKETLSVIEKYIDNSKGVDLCNQRCTNFRYDHSSKKWWKPLCFHILQLIYPISDL